MSEDQSFESVKERLDEIVEAVNDEDMSLEAVLDLYEEAVSLGMQASSILEENIGIGKDGFVEAEEEGAEEAEAPQDEQASSDATESNMSSDGPEQG